MAKGLARPFRIVVSAAQGLAARDILVLQLQDINLPDHYKGDWQRKEVESALAIYRSAIKSLDRRGLIDTHRIGIIGYSHTCFYVKYALAHFPSLFAAASVAEGPDRGYLQYMARSNEYVDASSLYGGAPFGHRVLRNWIDQSPSFNLDRVRAPLRITVLNPRFLLGDWEWFDGLYMLRKPVEMVMLESGDHSLVKPSERMVVSEGNIDWCDFWLNGRENWGVGKAEQYARWRRLREVKQAAAGGLTRSELTKPH